MRGSQKGVDVAKVSVNGQTAGRIWTYFDSLDVTDIIQTGDNALSIDISTVWKNRLIVEAATISHGNYFPDAMLRNTGMKGPSNYGCAAQPELIKRYGIAFDMPKMQIMILPLTLANPDAWRKTWARF